MAARLDCVSVEDELIWLSIPFSGEKQKPAAFAGQRA
jgi:hypothetical protein